MKAIGYQVFVMIELAKVYNVLDSQQEYDSQWEMGERLFVEFDTSEFNDPKQPEYDCMEKFLIKVNADMEKDLESRTPKEELELNIEAMEASISGDTVLANTIRSLIDLKKYKRLDRTWTLDEMKQLLTNES